MVETREFIRILLASPMQTTGVVVSPCLLCSFGRRALGHLRLLTAVYALTLLMYNSCLLVRRKTIF